MKKDFYCESDSGFFEIQTSTLQVYIKATGEEELINGFKWKPSEGTVTIWDFFDKEKTYKKDEIEIWSCLMDTKSSSEETE